MASRRKPITIEVGCMYKDRQGYVHNVHNENPNGTFSTSCYWGYNNHLPNGRIPFRPEENRQWHRRDLVELHVVENLT